MFRFLAQEEMAEAIGRTQSRVSEILSEMADLPKLIKSFTHHPKMQQNQKPKSLKLFMEVTLIF